MFDVVVIGGGHAGCEAAAAAARVGARTLLLTAKIAKIGELSCNPSIGGIGKGHIVCEIDALDGLMGQAADMAGIHFKLLNRRKGPAVRGLRCQADRGRYRSAIQGLLHSVGGLEIREDIATGLLFDRQNRVRDVLTGSGRIRCGSVVITAGTFLGGVMHVGENRSSGGRFGDACPDGLTACLKELCLPLGRLKTGTPPRLLQSSIDWTSLEADVGDTDPQTFSTLTDGLMLPQIECRVTATTSLTHEIVRENLAQSARFSGAITGAGPRYCPSLEDKVIRFASQTHHRVFLEPEALDSDVVYPNGLSTSLPGEVQARMIRTIPGLNRAVITQWGYAVEYDFLDPRSLSHALEMRDRVGLFFAGQVNGTTGYEEAAGQGLLAGLNAAARACGRNLIQLDRRQSYIGIMVDDLVTRGVTEPYRMFTSRADNRIFLRCDNADERLTPLGIGWGCVSEKRAQRFTDDQRMLSGVHAGRDPSSVPQRVSRRVEADRLYAPYIAREARASSRPRTWPEREIPRDLSYETIGGLTVECREKLSAARPRFLAEARLLEGVTPAAIDALRNFIQRGMANPNG